MLLDLRMQNKILILNYGHFETYKYLIKIILDQIQYTILYIKTYIRI